ncbi:glycoside hydrolase family 31 protein [Streptomyces pactum]|uniref:glycoside hydrolase family 31 protein n=1 Tax=Streptomyces pactum TaxID=68249 RepID=UPI0036F8E738
MDARDLVRSVRVVGTAQGLRSVRSAWRRHRADAAGLPRQRGTRARVPGQARGAEPRPGGGVVWFARSALQVRVAVGGAVFFGWDGAGPEPSYALDGRCPEADERAVLEPDTAGGWRVVSERVTVVISRTGAVELRTPGGVPLRRDLPPRWWDVEPDGDGPAADGGARRGPVPEAARAPGPRGDGAGTTADAGGTDGPRWVQRSEVAADARFFGLGGGPAGLRLRDGAYRLWNTGPRGGAAPADRPPHLTMPVQLVVADAGTHLVFHDNTWDGTVTLREGEEGMGSGHDRPGGCELRMDGGPLRSWVIVGTPARVLHGWAALTGGPALPPRWALGHHHGGPGLGDEERMLRVAAGYRERGLPLAALHLAAGHPSVPGAAAPGAGHLPGPPGPAERLRELGVRLVATVEPAVPAEPGDPVYDGGAAEDAFVRDARGRVVRGAGRAGEVVFPDFTDPRVRKWWGGLYAQTAARGFAGVCHDGCEPVSFAAFGDPTLPRSARHDLDGRGGDHRAAHNVYALAMARAGHRALRELRPTEPPFLLSRSGWAGLQRYGGAWCGEIPTGWPGLRTSLAAVVGLGLCGVPFSGPDIGGATGDPSPELYLRWFQLAAHLPLFRTRGPSWAGPREPWAFGPQVLEHAAAALRERQRLMPYFVTLAHVAQRSGAPYVRPVWWRQPRDRALRDCEDAFLLGDSLLVAPALAEGERRRSVPLPRGRWYDVVTGQAFDGPGRARVEVPLSRAAVLARAGSVVPVAGADGEVELEVWPPVAGRTGGGLLITDGGGDGAGPVTARFTTRLRDGRVVVEREGGRQVGLRVRVREV